MASQLTALVAQPLLPRRALCAAATSASASASSAWARASSSSSSSSSSYGKCLLFRPPLMNNSCRNYYNTHINSSSFNNNNTNNSFHKHCFHQRRGLARVYCVGRVGRDIIQEHKLERMIRKRGKDPKVTAKNREPGARPPSANLSMSFMEVYPRELLDTNFDDLEAAARGSGRGAERAKTALKWLLSPVFDKPR